MNPILSKEILSKHLKTSINLSDSELNYIFSHFKIKKYKKHQFLFQEGDFIEFDYFILNGIVKSYMTDSYGKEHIINLAYEYLWISDYLALFGNKRTNQCACCIEETNVLSISLNDKDKLCNEIPSIRKYFREKNRKAIISYHNRITSMLTLSIDEKHEWFKNEFSKILNKVPKSLIASYIGVSRETLSRTKEKKYNRKWSKNHLLHEKISIQ
ncbi:Crp/Fnr family transcriptional regulator [Flavobacterium jejuense]|uniref:Crp/Fnr family transcriptional regulator n=1 Tax=Flavobacterium jejuense TaxID=1544455 RepID=A0ABX0IT94_9FLAO|nr:Crp/Fnr family transcriptional regulator [Flavobacterium jejuense]NHN26918.1 Crp/Fnr family transcriptional regulator [Flavobacterium jejuense]